MKNQIFYNLPLRYKLLVSYSVLFIFSISAGSAGVYHFVRKTIEHNIESELQNSTKTILNMVHTSTSVSIKNYLRAAAETNRKIADYYYRLSQQGVMSEETSMQITKQIMLSQRIGSSGYIYCLNKNGNVAVHPQKDVMNTDVSGYEFARQQKEKNQGYFEYEWQNPQDDKPRPKAVYWTYFEPWDWLISASSYRKEFVELVNVDDFRQGVLSLHFGKTGYSYVADSQGNTIIHPKNQGINIYKEKGVPNEFFSKMLKLKTGKLIHYWKNPGETNLREKLVIFNFLPEYNWIIASSSYLDEFYAPLKSIRNIVFITLFLSFLVAFPVIFRISALITNPLKELIDRFASGAAGDFSVRMNNTGNSKDEIGSLQHYFNTFMEKLEKYSTSLKQEIREHLKVKKALVESQKRYRSFMEAVPDPVIVFDETARATYLNPAFSAVFGWTEETCLGRTFDAFLPEEDWSVCQEIIETIRRKKILSQFETQLHTKGEALIHLSISAAAYRMEQGLPPGIVIILRDVTQSKWLERKIMEIGDIERQKVGQDLHDDLCPHLIGIESLCKAMENKLADKKEENAHMMGIIAGLVTEAIEKTRQLSRGLCPVHLVEFGLSTSLKEFIENTQKLSDANLIFNCDPDLRIRNNTVSTHLFRIVQESINNALKHGKPENISLSLLKRKDSVVLEIEDDGTGFEPSVPHKGMGLKIMQFRAKMIGALFDIISRKGHGTQIHISL